MNKIVKLAAVASIVALSSSASAFWGQIAFVTETPSVRAIVEHIGGATNRPAISAKRGPELP